MADYRLIADTWLRLDPDTIDDKSPRQTRLVKGDIVKNVTEAEVEYLTTGARPMLVEANSDADPFKENEPERRPEDARMATKQPGDSKAAK
jgi:hypothetical protein